MNTAQSVILACCAMLLLVIIVSLRLMQVRFSEAQSKRIHPQKLANSKQITEHLTGAISVSDNYRNLFELPVLFYLLCALVVATHTESRMLSAGVWLFVLLRYAHSFIHCTHNRVMHRFSVFAAGLLVLVALWLVFLSNYF